MTGRLSSKARKKQIFKVSLKIINEEGFYNLTMRNIAGKIGISEAAVYRHFTSKEELINELADNYFCQKMDKNNLKNKKNAIEKLKYIMESQFEIFSEDPLITAITFQEEMFREFPETWNKFRQHTKRKEKTIINIIETGQTKNEISQAVKAEAFTVLFMGAIRMTVLRWKENDFSYSIIEAGKGIFQEITRNLI